jgi:hypothetical protein
MIADKFTQSSVGNPEENKPLRMPRRRWEDDIKMQLTDIGYVCGLDSSAQDRDQRWTLVKVVMNLGVS